MSAIQDYPSRLTDNASRKFETFSYLPAMNDKQIREQVQYIVDQGYNKAKKVLTEKIDDLHKLAKALLTYETLTGDEIEDLVNKNIYPANKEDLKVEDEDQGSALGSIGLKPKIVH